MKVKFNLFERVAGLFVLTAAISAVGITIAIGVKKGWFEPKIKLKTFVSSADGLHPGTLVQLSGLQIGSVDDVDLQPGQRVEITFKIIKRFSKHIRQDSVVKVMRPFIIGEKVLELTTGSPDSPKVHENDVLIADFAPDFLEFLGGNKLGSYMQSLDKTMQNLHKLAEAFFSDERSDKIIELFDKMIPLMDEMNVMAREVGVLTKDLNHNKKMDRTLTEFLALSKEVNAMLPKISDDVPHLSKNVLQLTKNLNQLTSDFQEMLPIFKKMAPDFPEAGNAAMQALNEAVITLRAMQKTFFLRSSVREVLEEAADQKKRQPASQPKDKK